MAKTFTELFYSLVPSWLSAGDGGKVLHSLALIKDKLVTRARGGLNARFPSRAGASALAMIAADRVILRGRSETSEHFAERLTRWRYPKQHRVRGGAFALLDQIVEYVGGARAYTLDKRANVHVRGASSMASTTYSRDAEGYGYNFATPITWDALPMPANWARFWVVLCASPQLPWLTATPNFSQATLWGGKVGTPGYSIGLAGWNPTDTANIRKLFRGKQQWRPAGTRAEWLIVQLTDWTGELAVTTGTTWGTWAVEVANILEPARSSSYRYISLSPEVNNIYAGDPTRWPVDPGLPTQGSVRLADGSLSNGVEAWASPVTLADGSTYVGNPERFPVFVQQPDDGDQT